MFCKQCGKEIADAAAICVHCGVATKAAGKSRVAFVLLGLFLGGLGIHNFFAGYTTKGVIQLLISLFTGWLIFPLIAVWIWVIIEIIAVTKDANGVEFS